MTHSSSRLMDEFAKLMNDAAGVAQGVKREAETAFRSQAERLISQMDLVSREEFDAVKDMAALARKENETRKAQLAEFETKLAGLAKSSSKPAARKSPSKRSSAQKAEPAKTGARKSPGKG